MIKRRVRGGAALALLAALLLGLLAGCGGAASADVSAQAVSEAVEKALNKGDSLAAQDAAYIKGYMRLDEGDYEQARVLVNVKGTSYDEFGVFQAKDAAQARSIREAVEAYLKLKEETDMGYLPEELPKLSGAEVRASGNYVMYCVLSDSDKNAAFAAFSSFF